MVPQCIENISEIKIIHNTSLTSHMVHDLHLSSDKNDARFYTMLAFFTEFKHLLTK